MNKVNFENTTSIPAIAEELKVSRQWVHNLWRQGRIHGRQYGNVIILDREDAIRVITTLGKGASET